MNNMANIFYEMYQRYPTIEEAEELLEEICIRWSFCDVWKNPEIQRADEVQKLLDEPVEQISVDEIYAQFQDKIRGIRLDKVIQSAYFWRTQSGDYYVDDLTLVNRLTPD